MLMKHKPSQCLAMPPALLKSVFCAYLSMCVGVNVLCVRDDSSALAWLPHTAPKTGLTETMPGCFYTWHQPKQKGRSGSVQYFFVFLREEKVAQRGEDEGDREGETGRSSR